MKLLAVKVECSHELEDGLSFFMQDELDAQGIESRKRSDFIAEGQNMIVAWLNLMILKIYQRI